MNFQKLELLLAHPVCMYIWTIFICSWQKSNSCGNFWHPVKTRIGEFASGATLKKLHENDLLFGCLPQARKLRPDKSISYRNALEKQEMLIKNQSTILLT